MENVKPWVMALGVPPQQYALWKSEAPDLNFITFWSLEKGYLPVQKYLDWAKEHYGLPVLSDDFINEAFDKKLWDNLKSVSNWSKEFQPVCEWDGVIFIACVEPREDIQWSFPVRYVLASPKLMVRLWNRVSREEDATVSSKPVTVNSELVTATVTTPPPINSTAVAVNIEPAAVTVQVPEPLPESSEQAAENSEQVALGEEIIEKPDGILETPPPLVFDFSNIKLATEKAEKPDAKPIPAPSSAPVTPPVPPKVSPPPPTLKVEATKPSAKPVGKSQIGPEFFTKLKETFLSGAVFYFYNESFNPIGWSDNLTPGENASITNLNDPSAFRIAYRTKKPYFGYLVGTPVNTAIFNAWGFTELPKTVLIQPVLSDGFLIGMLLCICESDTEPKLKMQKGAELAKLLIEIIKNQSTKAA